MARINLNDTTSWKDWQDGNVMKAADYKKERQLFATAINDIEDSLDDVKTDITTIEGDLNTIQNLLVQNNPDYMLVAQIMEVY